MKHIASHHRFAMLHGASRARSGRDPRSAWAAAATAASAAVKRHFQAAPSRSAPAQPASVPADAQTAECTQGVSLAAAPAEAAAARWERRGTRAIPWVEGMVLVLLIAYFGGGLAAILGGF